MNNKRKYGQKKPKIHKETIFGTKNNNKIAPFIIIKPTMQSVHSPHGLNCVGISWSAKICFDIHFNKQHFPQWFCSHCSIYIVAKLFSFHANAIKYNIQSNRLERIHLRAYRLAWFCLQFQYQFLAIFSLVDISNAIDRLSISIRLFSFRRKYYTQTRKSQKVFRFWHARQFIQIFLYCTANRRIFN